MKNIIKKFQHIAFAVFILFSATACGQTAVQQVKIKSDFASAHCQNRIEENISMEKGVKKVTADLATQIITIEYLSDKNTAVALAQAVKKLGYAANVMSDQAVDNGAASSKCQKAEKCCPKAGTPECCKNKGQECKMKQANAPHCQNDTIQKSHCQPGCQKPCCKK